ncbi:MAG: flagellar assembly protein FliW [Lachnospiraceae bacterium]|uniref:Flagellar assembly factor FliW n=1 Tax=Candidatus Weimeria bifida TaxID=2599074 RepID=A0A6N7J2Q8_9FIRM|nr:flagellar assembly protein FliW [Candidatus Weimeria bifida]RRF97393.1 MAG: flagellar assembly protein FliW [Lachnospiraceae bacterium]
MKVNTRLFGEIDIADDKIIEFPGGIIGFPDMQKFTLIYDLDGKGSKEDQTALMYLQSMDEPQFAMPVVMPVDIFPDYNPVIDDDLLTDIGKLTPLNTYCLVTISVPSDIKKMTVNLKAPFIINTDTLKGAQVMVEDDVAVKTPVYDILAARKSGKEA